MLSPYDYLVIGFYFAFMLMIGWVCRRFISDTSDYFRGGGRILWWMVGSSAFMLSFSAWTFTGAASKAYRDGIVVLAIYVGNAIGFLFNYLMFASRFRQMRVITAMQAVRQRFGAANEQVFTWLQIPLSILYAGIWLAGLSVFISAVLNMGLEWTIAVTGAVVVVVAAVGGSWAVVAGDFIQMLILMPVTVVAAALALARVGGLPGFLQKLPRGHLMLGGPEQGAILFLWIVAVLLKQFVATNNMLEASRYLTVKDTANARRAALLGMALHIIGPLVWFIPPMVAAITHPDLQTLFPKLRNPAEGAYVATCLDVMPAGMVGLLISGIFAATMSAMDGGLNRNAGFFVKNFYQVVVKPAASEGELLIVSKMATGVFGVLVIFTAGFLTTRLATAGLFNQMLDFGALVALPYAMPLLWGAVIKRAPSWAGWSTALVGFGVSLVVFEFLDNDSFQRTMGWAPFTRREQEDWLLVAGVLLNIPICSAWFLGSCWFARKRSAAEQARVDEFFRRMATPIPADPEEKGSDARQCQTLGALSLAYGGFIALMLLIPNPVPGRVGIAFCALCMLGTGALLSWRAYKLGIWNDTGTESQPPGANRTAARQEKIER